MNDRSSEKTTPLIEAEARGDLRILALLLEAGADVAAAAFEADPALGWFTEKGIDLDRHDSRSQTPAGADRDRSERSPSCTPRG